MTTVEAEPITEQVSEVIHREFAAEVAVDGRTVDVRIVPYGETITHNDGLGGERRGVDYREEWLPGVFSHQVTAAHRVHANFEHQTGAINVVGHGLTLREGQDGFYGSFEIHETPQGETTLALLRAKSLDGVSLEAKPVRNIRSTDGIVQRAKANLYAIAFTRFAAYAGARVLALREEPAYTIDAELLSYDPDPEMVARCARLGIRLPQRYEAHPAEGHPGVADTSSDDTRPTETISTEGTTDGSVTE